MYLSPKVVKKPRNPFMYYSAFKMAVYYHTDRSRCHPIHSIETTTTIPQLTYKKVSEILLDRRVGFQSLIEKAIDLSDKIHTAILYSAYDEDLRYGKFIAGKWHWELHPDFTPDNMQAVSRIYSVQNGFAILHDLEANTLAIQ